MLDNKKMPAKAGTYKADTRSQLKNSIISEQCQMESYQFVKADRQKRISMILRALGETEMTAREIAYKLKFSDLNAVKPRLTELVQEGILEVSGKKFDELTKRKVSVYRRAA